MNGSRRAVVAPPLARLVEVEVRKGLDTRVARRVVAGVLGVLGLGVVAVGVAAPAGSVSLPTMLSVVGGALGLVVPILVILLVTSEWSHRTGLITFVLEPRRGRVVAAKLLAGVTLGLGAVVLAGVLSLLGTLLARQRGAVDWGVDPARVVGSLVLGTLVSVLIAFALAALLLDTVAAIAAHVVLTVLVPGVVGALSVLDGGFASVAPWIDLGTARAALTGGEDLPTAIEVARLLVTGVIWVALPLALGVRRLRRADVR